MEEQITPIYEDKNFLAVYKPAGLLTHAAPGSRESTLVDWLLKKYPKIRNVGDEPAIRPGIVHRLDKDTSGVILIAKNQRYFEYLKNLFQMHQIKKTYLALVWGKLEPRAGVIKKPIKIKPGTIKRTVWKGKVEKEAITEYKVLKYFKYNTSLTIDNKPLYFSLVKIMPQTGRTHQIRVHLASIGHPIVGDAVYGKKIKTSAAFGPMPPFASGRLFLHAESLEFSTAEGRRVKIESGLPEKLKKIISGLK